MDSLKADLNAKRAALKSAEKARSKESQSGSESHRGRKKAEAEAVLKKLLASGMSVDEILEKLK